MYNAQNCIISPGGVNVSTLPEKDWPEAESHLSENTLNVAQKNAEENARTIKSCGQVDQHG